MHTTRVLLLIATLAIIPACGGGGGGGGNPVPPAPPANAESEPNNTAAEADACTLGLRVFGDLDAIGDTDFWSVSMTAGNFYTVELFGIRLDQAGWTAADNIPRVFIIAPDQTSWLLNHNILEWAFPARDLDMPFFRATTTGTHYIRVEQMSTNFPGGDYSLVVTESEGQAQGESEPNNTSATADAVTPGLIHAIHENDNDDFYSFTVPGPTVVGATLIAYRRGIALSPIDAYYDPLLQLLDTNGATVLQDNDDDQFRDPGLRYLIVNAGTYFIRVAESTFGSDGDSDYALFLTFAEPEGEAEPPGVSGSNNTSAGAEPGNFDIPVMGQVANSGDVDFFSFPATAGDLVHLNFFDQLSMQGAAANLTFELRGGTNGNQVLPSRLSIEGPAGLNNRTAIIQASGTIYVRVSGAATSNYGFRLMLAGTSVPETETNNTPATANAIPADSPVSGVIGVPGDVDHFSFAASTAGEVIVVSLFADITPGGSFNPLEAYQGHGSTLVPLVTVVDANGNTLRSAIGDGTQIFASGVVNGAATLELAFVAPAAGTYYARVTSVSGSGGATQFYLLQRR